MNTAFGQYQGVFESKQMKLDGLNISTLISNRGIFNQDITMNNFPGLEWPKGGMKYALFTSGITIATYINNSLKMASNSWTGEYRPGYIQHENGTPTPFTDERFRIYKITKNDNCNNSTDWIEWEKMIPFGAPYTDRNNNCSYEPCIDIPGVEHSYQTVFVHLTDGFIESHTASEGFGGGTSPVFAEMIITAWTYWELRDVQYFKFTIINKNDTPWTKTRIALMSDTDLGDASDDFIGCDTLMNLGISYNSDNYDGFGGIISYGLNPPSSGQRILKAKLNDVNYSKLLTSFIRMNNTGSGQITCEREPANLIEAVNFMNGLKNDSTPFLNPTTFQPVKLIYPGDPDLFTGWSERGTDGDSSIGNVLNCNGNLTGQVAPGIPANKRYVMGIGPFGFNMNPMDTLTIYMSQMVAKGSNNFNAVTKLKQLSDQSQRIFDYFYNEQSCDAGNVMSLPPTGFYLSDNYPNPFNPTTRINYGLPIDFKLEITVYDAVGNEVAKLFDGMQQAGNYTLEFNGNNLASGVYFLKMKSGAFIVTRKLMLLK